MDQKDKLISIIKTLDLKKAQDIEVIEIKGLTIIADYFVIASGTSNTHVKTLGDEVEFQLKKQGVEPTRTEGYHSLDWLLLDYSDIVIHVFKKDTREFYSLSRLWNDGKKVDISQYLK